MNTRSRERAVRWTRLPMALWHLASRWDQVGAEGRIVQLPNLTAKVLANIVGARRQSVSTALSALQRSGLLVRREDRSWVIPAEPPQLRHLELGWRASDVPAAALQTAG